ncbi:MAG: hypothetical protein M0P01_06315 [Treponema sp.]|nr:hypothetical protein [Treponema sp.]
MKEDIQFKSTLQILVPLVVQQMCMHYHITEADAVTSLYTSKLYTDLEREQTKLWHLSPLRLADLWHEEQITGTITYPEEA